MDQDIAHKEAAQRSTPTQETGLASKQSSSTKPKRKAGGNYGNFIDRARAVGDKFERQ